MTGTVTVDVAGARMGGAARYAAELRGYLQRTARPDVRVIGGTRRVEPSWLLRRELGTRGPGRRVALNNVSFVAPGGERWALLRNALHFLTDAEARNLDEGLLASVRRDIAVVRLSARRADTIVVPCSAMAERVVYHLPSLRSRLIVRPHPVSADAVARQRRDPAILCPVLFASYKRMEVRLTDLLKVIGQHGDRNVRVRITANPADLPHSLTTAPNVECLGRLDQAALRDVWARSRAIYFPTALESFGYPLAEARVSGQPVIALDTDQNREIAGSALCGFRAGNIRSLYRATVQALTITVTPDPEPFDPDSYFDWLLGRRP
jgi:glycosyltransferase involved in cell wall biosynthesis